MNQYDVIFLNMQHFLIRAKEQPVTDYLEKVVIEEMREVYGELFSERETILAAVLEHIYAKTKKKFIFLINEWDCVMRERQELEAMQREYLDFLRNLLKDQSYVALAYMTGILPVKKYGQHSAPNMFWEYSMTNQYALEKYTGFIEDEVKALCAQFHMDFVRTSSWYDGYRFRKYRHIYNPRSVVAAMSCQDFSSYWTSRETYDALKIYMDMDFDVLTLLIHLGYLGYDAEKEEAFIPNKEIIREFENAMSVGGWPEVMRVLKESEKLLEIREYENNTYCCQQ